MKNRKMAWGLSALMSIVIILILVDVIGSVIAGVDDFESDKIRKILLYLGACLAILFLVCDIIFVLSGNRKFYFASYIACLIGVLIVFVNDITTLIDINPSYNFPLLAFVIMDGLLFVLYCIPFFSESIKNIAYLLVVLLMIVYFIGLFINSNYKTFISFLIIIVCFSYLVDSIVKLIGSFYERVTIVRDK